MKTFKILSIWIVGLIITLSAAIYQRLTGPTYPYRTTIEINDRSYNLEFTRSGSISSDAEVILDIDDSAVSATLNYRKFPTNDPFIIVDFISKEGKLIASLPKQPMAGKLNYEVNIQAGDEKISIPPQVIRFKGDVPDFILAPHIFFMFLTMFFSNVSGLFAAFNFTQFKRVGVLTFWSLVAGGMILGPVVQKYAFDELWAGVPYGWDLTDNKTLIAFVFWLAAFLINRKTPSRTWTIIAAVVTMLIFAIPHSMFGSELNPETGKIIQGIVYTFFSM